MGRSRPTVTSPPRTLPCWLLRTLRLAARSLASLPSTSRSGLLVATAPGERVVVVVVVCRFVHHHAQPTVCYLYNFRLELFGHHTSDGSCICCNCDAVAEDGKFCLAS